MSTPVIHTWTLESPLGGIRAAATGSGLCGLWFQNQRHLPRGTDGWIEDEGRFQGIANWLRSFFAGSQEAFDLPLDLSRGTAFQQRVWRALLAIPPGETRSYAQIALALGLPLAARAVGAAVGRNPLSILVPCHRVVGADGALTGYAGGLERKRWLLEHEQRLVAA